MDHEQRPALNRRAFLKRAAGLTAGAAALTGAGVASGVVLSTDRSAPASVPDDVAPALATAELTIEVFDSGAGQVLGTFSECVDLGSESEVIEHKITMNGMEIVRKIPGRLRYPNVTLRRGLGTSNTFWNWREAIVNGKFESKTLLLRVRDPEASDRTEIARWKLDRAWPGAVVMGGNGDGVIEQLTLVHERMCREV